jgi:hypothetical protein
MDEQTRVPVTEMGVSPYFAFSEAIEENLYLATCKMCGKQKSGVGGKTNLCRRCAREWREKVREKSHQWLIPKHLEWLKVKKIHWNAKINGGWFEYYLPLKGNGRGDYDSRLGIHFPCDYYPERPFMVWHVTPSHRTSLKGVLNIANLITTWEMISGRRCPVRGKTKKEKDTLQHITEILSFEAYTDYHLYPHLQELPEELR